MDIKLKRDVKHHITSDTSFNELVEIADKRYAIAHSTELYDTRIQHTNAVSNAVIQPRPKDTRNNTLGHHQWSSNNSSQYNKVPPHEKERRNREGAFSYCGKIGHFSSDCYQKPRTQNHHHGLQPARKWKKRNWEQRKTLPFLPNPGRSQPYHLSYQYIQSCRTIRKWKQSPRSLHSSQWTQS